ncbi:cell wall-binding protein [Clostridium sp.]|uniref:cell wall-binding protein n=1 Tax=Clostridium sp. TaxID=1506 RepID=UPI00283B026B|nr:cell wall-binding protein [Clostridium sp.]MDR3594885.1 cell wall-binding protein [Clostridium sp.]
MIKRITKITGLLMSAASVISIMPVQAADIPTLDTKTGYVYGSKAKGDGIFVDGEIDGADEACYWMTDDGKFNKLDAVPTGSNLTDELAGKYLEIDTGVTSGPTYLDKTNGYKDVGYDVRQDLENTAGIVTRAKLRHDNNDRFVTINDLDFYKIANRESSVKVGGPTGTSRYYSFVASDLSVYQVPVKDALPAGMANAKDVAIYRDAYASKKTTNPSGTSAAYPTDAIYADNTTGDYVDADYNLGSVKIYAGSTTGASVILKNTDDNYELKSPVDGKTYKLRAVLQESKYLTEFSDKVTVEREAYLTIYKSLDGVNYKKVSASDGFTFGGDHKNSNGYSEGLQVDGTMTVVQTFSKTAASDTVDGIKYPKDSTIYFLSDKNDVGVKGYFIGDSATNANTKTGAATSGSTKVTANDKAVCSIYLDTSNNEIYAETGTLTHKNSFNYVDIGDYDSSDIDSDTSGVYGTGINNTSGLPWFVNSGYIMTWDDDHSFTKVARIDGGITRITPGSKSKIFVWYPDKEVYAVLNIPKAATTSTGTTAATTGTSTTKTTTGAAVTVDTTPKAGWAKNSDNTWSYLENGTKKTGWVKDSGSWYYLKADGVMAKGWANDNGTWYYLSESGGMKTGWINDNEAWYYCNESGAMLSNTIVDGYVLGSDGAWIK